MCCNGLYGILQESIFNISSVFQTYVVSLFIWMLHRFYTYVANVLSGGCVCLKDFQVFYAFLQVFQTHVSSVSSVFFCMLHVLRLDVLKVDRVLHLFPRLLLPYLGVSSSPYIALHPSQTVEGARRGAVEGEHQAMAAQTQVHALSFRYAGR
jgi:hypothetical protein